MQSAGATDIVCNALAQKALPLELLSSLFYAMRKFIEDELKAGPSQKETDRLDSVLTTSYTAMWNNTTPVAVFDILSSLGSSRHNMVVSNEIFIKSAQKRNNFICRCSSELNNCVECAALAMFLTLHLGNLYWQFAHSQKEIKFSADVFQISVDQ